MGEELKPVAVVLLPDVAAEIAAKPLIWVYDRLKDGTLKSLAGPGEKRVLTVSLENAVGRRLTPEDIEAAERRAAPKRKKRCEYMKSYRAARTAQSEKRQYKAAS